MESQNEIFPGLDEYLKKMSNEAREGLLFLCLTSGKTELVFLSQLLKSPESIDALMIFPLIQVDLNTIQIDPKYHSALLQKFKWSEKVKASGVLAQKFENKNFDNENLGDLWLMAGNKEKAKNAFLLALNQYKKEQFHPLVIRVGEKILNLDILSQEEEIDVLQNLIISYECCGELSLVIHTRQKLIDKPLIKSQGQIIAPIMRALAIDYSKQGNWHLYKELRIEASLIFRKNKILSESAGEFMALAQRAIDELNLIKGFEYSDEALHDAHISGQTEVICKSMAIKAYALAMDGKYISGQKMAQEALQLALSHNLLEAAAFVYRKLAGTYEYASDFEKAKLVYNEAIDFCETEQMEAQVQMCYSCLSWIFLRLGEWKKAIDVCTILTKDTFINNASKSTAHCVIAIIKSLRGEIRSAEKHALKGIFLAQKEQFMIMFHLLHLPMAKINELKEDMEGAKEWYCRIIDEWPLTGEKHDVLLSLMDAAMFFREHNDQGSLNKCLKIISSISKETGNSEALGCLEYGLGLDALLKGHFAAAKNRLTEAKNYLEHLNVPYQTLLVDYHLLISHLSLKEMDKGQQILMNILSKAKKMGLSPMVTKLNKAFEKSASKTEAILNTLTRRQMDVLQLLSNGLSNKEIAVKLCLSPRTIDMHIRFIFEKLYCRTRTEAVKIGTEKGLIPLFSS